MVPRVGGEKRVAIYFQHVGERGGSRDFPKTIGDAAVGLRQFTVETVPGLQNFPTAEVDRLRVALQREGLDSFQIWGVPSGAKSIIASLSEGDWFLLLTSDRPGGQFYYGGQVIFRMSGEQFGLSRELWGEERFPLLIFMRGRLTSHPWETFRRSFGFKENWRLAGQTYRLTPERLSQSPYADERLAIDAILGPGLVEVAEASFLDITTQIELLIGSSEGRQVLRAHLARERDPRLILAFKNGLRDFRCSVCGFDFARAYGPIGAGFIEAHHVEPIGLREGEALTSIADLIPVCSNCHSMLHRQVPTLTADELSGMMALALERHG